uniref:Uncharacterized protein n=1 Tax=Arundo donax TaxID=35708 RepID=A0A0A8XXW2_ARUDO
MKKNRTDRNEKTARPALQACSSMFQIKENTGRENLFAELSLAWP